MTRALQSSPHSPNRPSMSAGERKSQTGPVTSGRRQTAGATTGARWATVWLRSLSPGRAFRAHDGAIGHVLNRDPGSTLVMIEGEAYRIGLNLVVEVEPRS